MEYLDAYVKSKRPELLKRTVLNSIALSFGIDPSFYKNKRLLCNSIDDTATYNTQDPVTLEDVKHIPPDEVISWWQKSKRYIARTSSMVLIMNSENTMNPWVIDSASGIQQALNPDEYDKMYNLKYVKQLKNVSAMIPIIERAADVPDDVRTFFKFQNMCGDLYVTALGSSLQSNDKEQYTKGVNAVLDGLYATLLQFQRINDVYTIHIIESCMYAIMEYSTINIGNPLGFIVDIFCFLKDAYPDKGEIIVYSVFEHASRITYE
jgi:hypothetical protein